jgi:hypothetical protein
VGGPGLLRLASARGAVVRGDVMARFALSGETARTALVALTRAGILERAGRGRQSHYRVGEQTSAATRQ